MSPFRLRFRVQFPFLPPSADELGNLNTCATGSPGTTRTIFPPDGDFTGGSIWYPERFRERECRPPGLIVCEPIGTVQEQLQTGASHGQGQQQQTKRQEKQESQKGREVSSHQFHRKETLSGSATGDRPSCFARSRMSQTPLGLAPVVQRLLRYWCS